jgi:hypothetical protein
MFLAIDLCNLEFAVLIYAKDWQRGCLNIKLPETPLWLIIEPRDVVFLKSSPIFYNVQKIKGTKKNFFFYSYLIKSSPDEVEKKGKVFLFQ